MDWTKATAKRDERHNSVDIYGASYIIGLTVIKQLIRWWYVDWRGRTVMFWCLHDDVIKMETFSALLSICAGNSPASGEYPAQRPVKRSFHVFFGLCLNKRLRKQSWGWWFETLSCPLWRHCICNDFPGCERNTKTTLGRALDLNSVARQYMHHFVSCTP